MSFFTNIGFADTALWQWKFSPLNDSVDNSGIVYIDNLLLTQNALSTNDFSYTSLEVNPNPANNAWYIKGNSEINKVALFDILGNEVLIISSNSNAVKIDASSFQTGVYFAKIESRRGIDTIKLIKQ